MPDIEELPRTAGTPEEEEELRLLALEEVPGHTPECAEGDDEDAPHREHPYPDPDKTPGRAEG